MRLFQLARKLDKTPSEIIHFYKTNNLGIYDSHNDKLEDEHVEIAMAHFNLELLTVEENDESIEEMKELSANADSIPDKATVVDQSEVVIEDKTESNKDTEQEIEVIRAPKIKLEGIKVVGKIDLPEKVIKTSVEKVERDDIEKTEKKISKERKIKNFHKKSTRESGNYRGKQSKRLSYEERLKMEENERIRKKREEHKIKKGQKKNHYKKNIQSKITSRAKKNSKRDTDLQNEPKREIPVYKNPFRKLWAWLNGEYDRF
jgi:hypothetical protein